MGQFWDAWGTAVPLQMVSFGPSGGPWRQISKSVSTHSADTQIDVCPRTQLDNNNNTCGSISFSPADQVVSSVVVCHGPHTILHYHPPGIITHGGYLSVGACNPQTPPNTPYGANPFPAALEITRLVYTADKHPIKTSEQHTSLWGRDLNCHE